VVEVPVHLRDDNRDAAAFGHGEGYQYPHEHPEHHIGQQYLPGSLLGTYFYRPSDQGHEREIARRLAQWREAQRLALRIDATREIPDLTTDQIEALKRRMGRASGTADGGDGPPTSQSATEARARPLAPEKVDEGDPRVPAPERDDEGDPRMPAPERDDAGGATMPAPEVADEGGPSE